jgi:hypothetical protein
MRNSPPLPLHIRPDTSLAINAQDRIGATAAFKARLYPKKIRTLLHNVTNVDCPIRSTDFTFVLVVKKVRKIPVPKGIKEGDEVVDFPSTRLSSANDTERV